MTRLTCLSALAASALALLSSTARADAVTEWSALAVGCANRPGPAVLLDLALVNAAMHDAIQAIEKRYKPYLSSPPANGTESRAAAAAAAARRMLMNVCAPAAQGALDIAYAPYLAGNDAGLAVGIAAAEALIPKIRPIPPITVPVGDEPGEWRPTPPSSAAFGFAYLSITEPLVMTSASQFRSPPPPALTSSRYTRDYNEVKALGGTTSHPTVAGCPAPRNTDMARFWSGNFVAQWNQVARDIALDRQLSIGDTARLLALVNLAAADAAIAVWDTKVHYNYWRPITAINLGDTDGNNNTQVDTGWIPFIQGSHFPPPSPLPSPAPPPSQTPPYPDYTSGANGLTGAVTTMLQLYFGTDWVPFEVNKAVANTVAICQNPRVFRRFSDAAEEVVEARILLGIHFRFADTEARKLGARVAGHTFANALKPVWPPKNPHGDAHDHDWKNHD